MKYRKWDPKTTDKIVLEGLQNNLPLSEMNYVTLEMWIIEELTLPS